MWIKSYVLKIVSVLLITAGCLVANRVTAADKPKAASSKSAEDILRLGERIYRYGILPTGEPVEAVVKGDIEVQGSMFSCQSCHMRGGMGSYEGGVYTPPTNGSTLYQPLRFIYKGFVQEQVPPIRPAYTDESLAEVLRYGDDPTGRILSDIMPRYNLHDADMAILVSYLKTLSAHFSPGVTDTTISFATVMAEDVSQKDRDEAMVALQNYVDSKNKLADYFETYAGWRSRRMAEGMFANSKEFARRKFAISRWLLKGPPETWRSQLDYYYRREPVFALLGGITTGEWGPIHKFCEENQIPSIFPYTDFPVISDKDWYTIYLSKGYYQEGEGAARFLNSMNQSIKDHIVVQIVRESRTGWAIADGFRKTWIDFGHGDPVTITLKEGEKLNSTHLRQISSWNSPTIVLIWDGAGALETVEAIAASKIGPKMIFLSYGYAGNQVKEIKENLRGSIYITHPYRLTVAKGKVEANQMAKVMPKDATRIGNQSFSIIEVLNMAFMRMKGSYYRDNFLDVIDCIMDLEVPYYERISFGPGQRYAVKGCYIVQLSDGDKPVFIKKSNWVSH